MLLANTLLQKKKLPHANIAYQGAQGKRATKLVAKPPGGVIHAPFGEPYAQAGATDLSFTGQNQDTVSGEYDFLAREYSMQGRWPSPDPAGLDAVDPSNPQSWNRYSYVINDPLDYIDPDGLFYGPPCGAFDDACSEPGPPQPFPPCIQAPEQSCGPTAPTDPGHPNPPSSGGNSSGGPANNGPVVVKNPCQFQGRALSPYDYSTSGQQAKNSTTNFVLDVSMGFPAGHYLDPQPLASGNIFQNQAYGNYTFGIYMAAAGVSLNTALSGANTYAFFFSRYPKGIRRDSKYGSLPAASVANITNGYNAQVSGTVCHN
jgi:RHS repeat-associated protein